MKTLSVIVLFSAALALAGCANKGGSSDPYNTGPGADSSANYNRSAATNNYQGGAFTSGGANSGDVSSTNYNRNAVTNEYQGGAPGLARTNTGAGYSTNYPGLGTNYDQGRGTNSQPIDPDRKNNVPDN